MPRTLEIQINEAQAEFVEGFFYRRADEFDLSDVDYDPERGVIRATYTGEGEPPKKY